MLLYLIFIKIVCQVSIFKELLRINVVLEDFIVARLEYNITDIVISNFEIGEINVQIGNSGFEIDM